MCSDVRDALYKIISSNDNIRQYKVDTMIENISIMDEK